MEGPIEEAAADDGPAVDLAATPPQERHELLCALVLRRAVAILKAEDLDEDSNFLERNMSSLAAVQLSKTLMDDTGLEVPLVAIVEHPTSTLLGKYLAEAYEAEAG